MKKCLTHSIRKAVIALKKLFCNMNYWEIYKILEPDYYNKAMLFESKYFSKIIYSNYGNDIIRSAVSEETPLMISRLGGSELDCIEFYLKSRITDGKQYPEKIREIISNNAGVFPANDAFLDRFAEFFLEQIKNVDIMGVWFNDYEASICTSYCPHASLIELGCIEPYHWKNPWSSGLKGKKVLVVHPFADSIRSQYTERRKLLFADPEVLPEFELKTVKAVQSIANSKVNFETWFDAYRYMCDEIQASDFDVAIIGAGAYGLPLASFVKNLGKQGIHLGGFTQVLFGIKGSRYEIEYADTTAKLFNKYWVKPSKDETPDNFKNVENGCYW